MKKVFNTIAVAAVFAGFTACGPSKEEIQAAEKRRADSIQAIEQQRQDSIKAAEEEIARKAAEEAEKMKQDSIRMADSIAAASKGKKKK